MKKTKYLLFLMLALLLVVSACGQNEQSEDNGNLPAEDGTQTEETQEEIVLRMITFQGSGQVQPLVEAFNEKYQGEIRIEVQNVASGAEALQIYQTQIGAGAGPDILYAGGGEFKTLVELGYLVDLSDKPYLDMIADDANEFFTVDGGTYILAWDRWWEGLLVNKGLLEEIGAGLPETYQDLIEIDRALQEAYGDVRAFHFGGQDNTWFNMHHGYYLAEVVAENPGIDARWNDGEENYADLLQGATDMFLELIDNGLISSEDLGRSRQLEHDIFAQEKSAFLITYVGFVPDILNANPELDVTMIAIPSLGGERNWLPGGVGSGYGMNVNTQYEEQVDKFFEFVASGEAYEAVVNSGQLVFHTLKDAPEAELPAWLLDSMAVAEAGRIDHMWAYWEHTGGLLELYWKSLQDLVIDPSLGPRYVGEQLDNMRDIHLPE